MDAALLFFVGLFIGVIATSFGFYIRDVTANAEAWGRSLGMWEDRHPTEHSEWRGLEDAGVRVRPIYDYDKEKKA